MSKIVTLLFITLLVVGLSGCGETLRGVGKDFQRVGRGVKTVFVAD